MIRARAKKRKRNDNGIEVSRRAMRCALARVPQALRVEAGGGGRAVRQLLGRGHLQVHNLGGGG